VCGKMRVRETRSGEGGGEMFSEGELPLRERGSGIYLCRESKTGANRRQKSRVSKTFAALGETVLRFSFLPLAPF
jgi:hypothetical protein